MSSSFKQYMLIQVQVCHCLQHRIAGITGTEQCADILVRGDEVTADKKIELADEGLKFERCIKWKRTTTV